MNEVIKVEGLTKFYNKIPVVNNLNLSVKKGTAFGLLGANGAGKSTTIECILGAKKADGGNISVLNLNPVTDRKKLYHKAAVQFQETGYQDQITVKEVCEVTASCYWKAAEPIELLKIFGIAEKQKSLVKNLSGGERQRLSVVLALIPNPEIVFLDELTTGLDVKARRDVWNILLRLKRAGLTIFLTSHFMEEVELLCDSICILKSGKPVFYGTVREATANSPYNRFEDAYLWYIDEEGK